MFNPDFFFHDFGSIVLDLRKKYDISRSTAPSWPSYTAIPSTPSSAAAPTSAASP